ncbi:MAG: hypothetical protein AB8B99_03430 [Phormidesmis sp.]
MAFPFKAAFGFAWILLAVGCITLSAEVLGNGGSKWLPERARPEWARPAQTELQVVTTDDFSVMRENVENLQTAFEAAADE